MAAVLLALCGCVVASVGSPSASAATHRRPVCQRYRCRTVAADSQVRVFRATSRHPGRELEPEATFAQWLPSGRVTALGDSSGVEGDVLKGLDLSGRFVVCALGVAAERYPGTGTGWAVQRLNAQTGHRERVSPDGVMSGSFGENSPGVTDVAVTPAGSIAWIDDGAFQNPLPGNGGVLPLGSKAVFDLLPSAGVPAVLAVSPAIDPKSLAAIPGRLYWIEGGVPRTASVR